MADQQANLTSIEQQLQDALQNEGVDSDNIEDLRLDLQTCCSTLLLTNYGLAQEQDVEQRLWKFGFYKHIEEFRKQIRKSGDQSRYTRSFKCFLDVATGFYLQLLTQLQRKYHLNIRGLLTLDQLGLGPNNGALSTELKEPHSAYKSCHRCLIYLGDIARYVDQINTDSSLSRQFASAQAYYEQALEMVPGDGSPHNQLAVLAAYRRDSFSAVYHYCRSMLVETPFGTTESNLKRVFTTILEEGGSFAGRSPESDSEDSPDTQPQRDQPLLALFVFIHSKFFLQQYDGVDSDMENFIEALTERLSVINIGGSTLQPQAVCQMMAINFFTLQLTESIEKHYESALVFCFDMAACLIEGCRSCDPQITPSFDPEILAGLKLFIDWLRGHEIEKWWQVAPIQSHRTWILLVPLLNDLVPIASVGAKFQPDIWQQTIPLPEDRATKGYLPLDGHTHLSQVAFEPVSGQPQRISTRVAASIRARSLVAFGFWACEHLTRAEMDSDSPSERPPLFALINPANSPLICIFYATEEEWGKNKSEIVKKPKEQQSEDELKPSTRPNKKPQSPKKRSHKKTNGSSKSQSRNRRSPQKAASTLNHPLLFSPDNPKSPIRALTTNTAIPFSPNGVMTHSRYHEHPVIHNGGLMGLLMEDTPLLPFTGDSFEDPSAIYASGQQQHTLIPSQFSSLQSEVPRHFIPQMQQQQQQYHEQQSQQHHIHQYQQQRYQQQPNLQQQQHQQFLEPQSQQLLQQPQQQQPQQQHKQQPQQQPAQHQISEEPPRSPVHSVLEAQQQQQQQSVTSAAQPQLPYSQPATPQRAVGNPDKNSGPTGFYEPGSPVLQGNPFSLGRGGDDHITSSWTTKPQSDVVMSRSCEDDFDDERIVFKAPRSGSSSRGMDEGIGSVSAVGAERAPVSSAPASWRSFQGSPSLSTTIGGDPAQSSFFSGASLVQNLWSTSHDGGFQRGTPR